MKGDGKVKFDQGFVVDNNDPERLGRVKVRLVTDGLNVENTMHKGDGELYWFEPCVVGAGYEVGSLIVPPVGAFVWCLECEFNTENAYRVYLGSAYGSGPKKSKEFNGMLTPPGVIETPTEALQAYPYTQLLYKSTPGSYMKFYGDSIAGFELCTGIPTKDAEGNAQTEDDYTYNYVYGDRKELLFRVAEMPEAPDKADPQEPRDQPISYTRMTSDRIYSGVVRDRGGSAFNNQEINADGIYMTVRGTGGTTSPSENKELEDKVTEEASKAERVAQEATQKATEEVTAENGPMDTQNKVVDSETEQTVNKAVNAPCKCDSKATGMSKKEASMLQEKVRELAIKLPGGYGFIQSVMTNAIQGNTKAIMSHLVSTASTLVFNLASAYLRDVFNDILSNPDIINTEEASKFIDKIIGEANLDKLIGKAQEMIAIIGGKLGPFGQVFERVGNTILGVATSKLGIVNQISNKIAGIASIKNMFDQLKPTVDNLIDTGLSMAKQATADVCIKAINDSMSSGSSVVPPDIQAIAANAISFYMNKDKDKDKEGGTEPGGNNGSDGNGNASPGGDNPGGSGNSGSGNGDAGNQGAGNGNPGNTATPDPSTDPPAQTPDPSDKGKEGGGDTPKLTPEEEETVRKLSEVSINGIKDAMSKAADSVMNSLIAKTLSKASEESKMETESSQEFENIIYLDADGARAAVPGEELSSCAVLNNDGAEVHVGEECLFQMTASNIMNFVSDPDYTNQTTRIIASDGIDDTINSETFSHESRNKATILREYIYNNDKSLSAGFGMAYDEESKSLYSVMQLEEASGGKAKSQAVFEQSISEDKPSSSLTVLGDQGAQSSSIQMEKDKIIFTVGKSSLTMDSDGKIEIKGTLINIGGADSIVNIGGAKVNLGATVNLGLVPDLGLTEIGPCTLQTGSVDWEISGGTMNIH